MDRRSGREVGCESNKGVEAHVSVRIQSVCIDTTDPSGLAAFWEQALGWRRTYDHSDEVVLEPLEGSREEGVVPDLLVPQSA